VCVRVFLCVFLWFASVCSSRSSWPSVSRVRFCVCTLVCLHRHDRNRVKYNFRKQRVIHIKRKGLTNIRGVTIGPLKRRKKGKRKKEELFGFRLEGDSDPHANRPHKEHQLYRMMLPPDSDTAFAKGLH
jgi:hypothetical protein